MLEIPPLGRAFPYTDITSAYVYKYISHFDNFILACEVSATCCFPCCVFVVRQSFHCIVLSLEVFFISFSPPQLLLIIFAMILLHSEVESAIRMRKEYIKSPWNCIQVLTLPTFSDTYP